MFFSSKIIKSAYSGLIKIDPSTGKTRKERVSGLRYLIATSQLLHREKTQSISLAVGTDARRDFISAVGDVVAINDDGLYSKDFASELDKKNDYGVGSNFLTTRLIHSRTQDILYPGRPANLLRLEQEEISILTNIYQILNDSYKIGNIKAELCIWLLRNDDFNISSNAVSSGELKKLIDVNLAEKYTSEIVAAITPKESEVNSLVGESSYKIFVNERADYSDIAEITEVNGVAPVPLLARMLLNDLPDDDEVFDVVQKLLERGAKGVLFSGPPGTSKTWYALKVALKIAGGEEDKLERIQFHPSYTYEDFIEGLVSTGSASGSEPMFRPKDKVFLHLCEKARSDNDNLYILIIDEFSRGDPSKIFGELLTYIEPDYREISFKLPYSEKKISIPQNIIIFATMNPYDKSVVDLDSAMERRFDVVELLPSVNILRSLLLSSGIDPTILGGIINFFNTVNKSSLSPHGFGHTYFKDVKEELDLILLWNHKLKFIFKKMLRFKEDAYKEVRHSYLNILSDNNKDKLT